MHASIFNAEARAISCPIKYIVKLNIKKSVVFTDSLKVVRKLYTDKPHKETALNDLVMHEIAAC